MDVLFVLCDVCGWWYRIQDICIVSVWCIRYLPVCWRVVVKVIAWAVCVVYDRCQELCASHV